MEKGTHLPDPVCVLHVVDEAIIISHDEIVSVTGDAQDAIRLLPPQVEPLQQFCKQLYKGEQIWR
tara:strand:- start:43 stop:237 length:195 start_codon:yes stop_codon:yes gene_type:complete